MHIYIYIYTHIYSNMFDRKQLYKAIILQLKINRLKKSNMEPIKKEQGP